MQIGYRTTFDAAHRLQNHSGKCRNLHGHTYIVEIVLEGSVANGGVVMDFGDVKKGVSKSLERWDHSVILERSDPILRFLLDNFGGLCILVMENEPTVENMIQLILDDVSRGLPGVELVSIRVYETPNSWAQL